MYITCCNNNFMIRIHDSSDVSLQVKCDKYKYIDNIFTCLSEFLFQGVSDTQNTV